MLAKKRFMVLVITLFFTFSFVCTPMAAPSVFHDTGDSLYREQIDLVTDLGFIFYYEKPYYAPDMIVTRDIAAETMYILVNGNLNEVDGIDYGTSIPDVRDYDYPVYYCRDKEIITVFADGSFHPNDPVTYGEFIKMMVVSLGLDKGQSLSKPKDYLSLAVRKGLTKGLDLKETDLLTNGHAALLVYNSLHIPAFGEGKKKTLLETTFQDLWDITQDLNRTIDAIDLLGRSPMGSKVPDVESLYDNFTYISDGYWEIYDININAAYKYDLNLNRFSELFDVVERLVNIEEEILALSIGEIRGDSWELADTQEALAEMEAAGDEYGGEYAPLLKKLLSRLKELTGRKLELLKASLPTEKDLQKGIKEMEQWMDDGLYGDKEEKSPTGVVFESGMDFIQLVETTYKELYLIYTDLYDSGSLADESYEERMDELYYLLLGNYYIAAFEDFEGEDRDPAEMAQSIVELLTDVEFIHYPEQAAYLIDKLAQEYSIE